MTTKRVLVVEDETITALDLRARLGALGYTVTALATSGEEAIGQAEETRPDLVLMDVRLAGEMDGIAAAEAIRARFNIPVVYLTAYSDDETLQRATGTGPFGYLLKPFSERELRTTIEVAFYKHRSETALQANERRMRLYARRLETLHEIDQAILAARSPEAIAEAALQRVQALIPCQRVSVTIFDRDSDRASLLAVLFEGETELRQGDLGLRETYYALDKMEQGGVQLVADLRAVSQPSMAERILLAEGIHAYVKIPLLVRGGLIGSLNLGATEPGAFDQQSLEIAHEVANSLALAIHHADLHAQVEQHAAELEVRNAELDAFAHTVAHDLWNPLGLVIGFADLLKQDWAHFAAEDVQKHLETIARTAFKMDNIVRELLLLAEVRKQDIDRVALGMGRIVAEAHERLAHQIKEHRAEIALPDVWPVALGHAPWVEEVWINYLSNAIKYGGPSPRVELGATEQPGESMVRFWVRDHGPGIALEDQPRLFAPFTQLSQVRAKGHGLGLSIVRRIVEKLGGQVGVESEGLPGQGSIFSFTLPADAPLAPSAEKGAPVTD